MSSKSAPHIATLVLMAGISALSMNIFLPSLPAIANSLSIPYALAQLVLTVYLAATAVTQIIVGPLSDRFGRRPVLLISYYVFIAGSVICIVAPAIEILLFGRVLQAASAAGFAISRAVIRDLYDRNKAASMIGYVTMAMAVVPMAGPIIGGYLEEWTGWRGSFYLLAAMGAGIVALAWFDLGETNDNRSVSIAAQFGKYGELLRERALWFYIIVAGSSSGVFFAFIGGAPFIGQNILGLRPSELGYYFVFVSVGYIGGNFLSGRFSERIGIEPMILAGAVIVTAGALISLMLFLLGFNHPASLFLPMILVGLGNGMTLPNATAGTVSVRPDLAGSASGLAGCLQIAGGAALAALASAMLSVQSGPYPLLYIMLASALVSVVFATSLFRRTERGAQM